MKNIKRIAALSLAAICALSACGVQEGMVSVSTNDVADQTLTATEKPADPKDDFYRYVNGDELANAEFEYGSMSYEGGFDSKLVEDQVKDIIREVVSGDGYEKGSEEDVIKTAYEKFKTYDFDAPVVPAELDACLHEIDAASSVGELLEIDAKLVRDYGLTGILNLQVSEDYLSSGGSILSFAQYRSVIDTDFKTLEETYDALNSLKNMGSAIRQAMGHDKEQGDEYGVAFGVLVKDLYNATDMEIVNAIMQFKYIKNHTHDEIAAIFSNVDIDKYTSIIGIAPAYCESFAVVDEGQLNGLNDLLTADNLEALKTWEMVALSSKYRRFMAAGYKELEQYRQIDYSSGEDQIINEIVSVYDETDPLYVERHYTEEMDKALVSMCDDIRGGYRKLISQADWLSEPTKKGLLKKLENIIYVTGADMKRHDVNDYKNLDGDDYFEFFRNYQKIHTLQNIRSLGEATDRKEITMPMQMVNACYDPAHNNITITVAITNAPFFDVNADYYTNLGGLGAVIAHEMGHAFDSNCILFNEKGEYDPAWINEADTAALNARNEKAIRYFEDNFTVFGVYHVDGEQTLGENYADLGGMECIVSLTSNDDQRKLLFENYARTWCEKVVDSTLLDQLDSDEHSPAYIRVNAILSTIDKFYETYGVTEDDGMYIAPEDRISRW